MGHGAVVRGGLRGGTHGAGAAQSEGSNAAAWREATRGRGVRLGTLGGAGFGCVHGGETTGRSGIWDF
jgi:hypothetical protein